jgi:hypothetical protein
MESVVPIGGGLDTSDESFIIVAEIFFLPFDNVHSQCLDMFLTLCWCR